VVSPYVVSGLGRWSGVVCGAVCAGGGGPAARVWSGPELVAQVADGAMPGQVVPAWCADLPWDAVSVDYRLLLAVLREASAPLQAKDLAGVLDLEVSAARVEGVGSKAERLVERGRAMETAPGLFPLPAACVTAGADPCLGGPGGGPAAASSTSGPRPRGCSGAVRGRARTGSAGWSRPGRAPRPGAGAARRTLMHRRCARRSAPASRGARRPGPPVVLRNRCWPTHAGCPGSGIAPSRSRIPAPAITIANSRPVTSTALCLLIPFTRLPLSRCRDNGKKINGRKRHVVVDTKGMIVAVLVTPADVTDRDAAREVLLRLCLEHPEITQVWADQGYSGELVT
jgi:Transposase DDE domain